VVTYSYAPDNGSDQTHSSHVTNILYAWQKKLMRRKVGGGGGRETIVAGNH